MFCAKEDYFRILFSIRCILYKQVGVDVDEPIIDLHMLQD